MDAKLILAKIPLALRQLNRWVLWKTVARDGKPTKIPYSVGGSPAKANDPDTWASFDDIVKKLDGFDGPGFEFLSTDGLCGVDLDGCRNPESGQISDWARDVIVQLDSYSEVSPSLTGVKIFVFGRWGHEGHKRPVDVERICDKEPAIEIYDSGRYFAVTGMRLAGQSEPQPRQLQIDALYIRFWPTPVSAPQEFYSEHSVADRAQKYLARMPASISGQGGHNAAFRAACVLILGFGLPESVCLSLMQEWNKNCQPPWSEHELKHKLQDAEKQPGDRNFLRNVQIQRFDTVRVPNYRLSAPTRKTRETTLQEAAEKYLSQISEGGEKLISTGIGELDYAIGGGFGLHEMILMCGRPGHGKSVVGLQCIHYWTGEGIPCAIISEEMSAIALGKRSVQYSSGVPLEHWETSYQKVCKDVLEHFSTRSECHIVEGCSTAIVACERLRSLSEKGVRCAVIDYAQLLGGTGKNRYEQLTESSLLIRQLANELDISLLVLCQLNREIEKRRKFAPLMSDIKETGQYEQDADVVLFGCWPHRLDIKNNPNVYQFFVMKNRHRATNQFAVECEFSPSRQKISEKKPPPIQDHPNYRSEFAQFESNPF